MTLPTAAAGKPKNFENKAQSDVWIVNGSKDKFKIHLVPKKRKMPIKLNSDTFGLVYHIDGTESGKRKYQVLRFNVKNAEEVQMETVDGNIEVNLNGNPVEATDSTVYDERKIKTKLEMAQESSKIAANIGKFLRGLAAIIYPGFLVSNY